MTNKSEEALTAALLADAIEAQRRAADWIARHVSASGEPVGAAEAVSWYRVPWALSAGGDQEVGARVLNWAKRTALTEDGAFRPGPRLGFPGLAPVYELAGLAIGAWRYDDYALAHRIIDQCTRYQSPHTGGVYDQEERGGEHGAEQDLLKTAQLGLASLVAGRREIADRIYTWLNGLWNGQTALPDVLQGLRDDDGKVVEVAPNEEKVRVFLNRIDFSQPSQAFYLPGIAAVFALNYASATGKQEAVTLGQRFLELNRDGAEAQFTDVNSVQICKYGWGAACEVRRDPATPWLAAAVRMARWFIERQAADGSWSPSTFLRPDPSDADKLNKTAEHLMEISQLIDALSGLDHAAALAGNR